MRDVISIIVMRAWAGACSNAERQQDRQRGSRMAAGWIAQGSSLNRRCHRRRGGGHDDDHGPSSARTPEAAKRSDDLAGGERHATVHASGDQPRLLAHRVLAKQQPVLDHVVQRLAHLLVVVGKRRVAGRHRQTGVGSALGFGRREGDELSGRLAAVVRVHAAP